MVLTACRSGSKYNLEPISLTIEIKNERTSDYEIYLENIPGKIIQSKNERVATSFDIENHFAGKIIKQSQRFKNTLLINGINGESVIVLKSVAFKMQLMHTSANSHLPEEHSYEITVKDKQHISWDLISPPKVNDEAPSIDCSKEAQVIKYQELITTLDECESCIDCASLAFWNCIGENSKIKEFETKLEKRLLKGDTIICHELLENPEGGI